ncbi:MAG: hypothetical protein LDLANPLL_00961 [Turneriella sp.]|nr:hypothetical protein [Turneriella sp.]
MHIRILNVALDNVDILVDEAVSSSVENHKLVPKKLLLMFLSDWLGFVSRVLAEKNSRPDDKKLDAEVARKLTRYGETLQTLLFLPTLNLDGAHELVFAVDADWARLPFEILPLRRKFAGLTVPLLRQIRTVSPLPAAEAKKNARRFLLMANTEGAADIAKHAEEEKASLKSLTAHTVKTTTLGKLASAAQVVDELTHCEYLHYAGHVRGQSLSLSESTLSANDIAALGLSHVKLAFVNGCNSAGELGETGLAYAFLSAGVKNYIGYNYPVSDAASVFAAKTIWGDFLRREKTAAFKQFFDSRSKKSLAEITLSARRLLFEKFGAAELAWLGIQFFTAPKERKRKKRGYFIAAAALFLVAVTAVFITRGRTTPVQKIQVEKKVASTAKRHSKKQVHPPQVQAPTETSSKPPNEEPLALTVLPRREQAAVIHSPALKKLAADFRTTPHPYYTRDDKEQILSEVLQMDVPESSKIIRLKNEMP